MPGIRTCDRESQVQRRLNTAETVSVVLGFRHQLPAVLVQMYEANGKLHYWTNVHVVSHT